MQGLLTVADFAATRAVLDVSINSRSIPDEVFLLAPFAPNAESQVISRVPDWQTANVEDSRHLKLAAIYLLGALIAPSIPAITGEQAGPLLNLSRKAVDWDAKKTSLIALFETEMSYVLRSTSAPSRVIPPPFFSLASGKRGG